MDRLLWWTMSLMCIMVGIGTTLAALGLMAPALVRIGIGAFAIFFWVMALYAAWMGWDRR